MLSSTHSKWRINLSLFRKCREGAKEGWATIKRECEFQVLRIRNESAALPFQGIRLMWCTAFRWLELTSVKNIVMGYYWSLLKTKRIMFRKALLELWFCSNNERNGKPPFCLDRRQDGCLLSFLPHRWIGTTPRSMLAQLHSVSEIQLCVMGFSLLWFASGHSGSSEKHLSSTCDYKNIFQWRL